MAELTEFHRIAEKPPLPDYTTAIDHSTQDANDIAAPQSTESSDVTKNSKSMASHVDMESTTEHDGNGTAVIGGLKDNEDEDSSRTGGCSKMAGHVQDAIYEFFDKNSTWLWWLLYVVVVVLYFIYFTAALAYEFGDEGSIRLLVVTLLVVTYLLFRLIEFLVRRGTITCCQPSDGCTQSFSKFLEKIGSRVYIALTVAVMLFAIIYIIVAVARVHPRNLISLGGMAVFVLLFYVFSHNPSRVNWRPVIWGILLQFIFAVIILRTGWGYDAFAYLGDRVTEFLAYTDAGSKFVFGDKYTDHFFAFKILPVVVFFSTFVTMLYHMGFMQFIIRNVGRFLAFCLGTSPTESLNAAGNIFIGQSESPLMIRPFLDEMTLSELHAVLTGGFATIAGSVMGAYILYGVPANHLLSASVMSAPAALAMSKLFYPETKRARHTNEAVYNMEGGNERNIIEAASNGATQSIKLVANITVNLIAFVALLDFVNATFTWFGDRIGMHDPKLTFQLICSYAFYPLSFLMGVDAEDRLKMGDLIGTKTFLNEFYAYTELSKYIKNRQTLNEYIYNYTINLTTHPTGYWNFTDGGVYLADINKFLEKGLLTERTVVVATYALCGFSNLASMGLMLGALGSMAPKRRSDIAGLVFRAMIAGNVACFMTACIAGLLST